MAQIPKKRRQRAICTADVLLKLEADQFQRLNAVTLDQGRPRSPFIRDAIEAALNRLTLAQDS